MDPLSDKYPSMSPYAYCANNPVILVDPDGRDIWIIGNDGTKTKYNPGEKYEGSDEFTRETFNALNRNCKYNDASRALKHLANGQRYQIEIHFSENTQIDEDAGLYDATYKAKISFNPYLGLRSKKTGKCITPATGLNHEFGHFLNMVEDIKKTKERLLTEVPLWGNMEEELTIKKYEHPMAEYFGEYLRESHDIKEVDIYTTKSSISTEKVERK